MNRVSNRDASSRNNQNRQRNRGRNNNSNSSSNNNNNNNNNNRRGPNPLQRSYESNGPDVKIRGNAMQVAEKYLTLARDAQVAGDRILAENYMQHAEHYSRIIAAAQAATQQSQQQAAQQAQDNQSSDTDQTNDSGSQSGQNDSEETSPRARQNAEEAVSSEQETSSDASQQAAPEPAEESPPRHAVAVVQRLSAAKIWLKSQFANRVSAAPRPMTNWNWCHSLTLPNRPVCHRLSLNY